MVNPGLTLRLKQACLSLVVAFPGIAQEVLLKNIWPSRPDFQVKISFWASPLASNSYRATSQSWGKHICFASTKSVGLLGAVSSPCTATPLQWVPSVSSGSWLPSETWVHFLYLSASRLPHPRILCFPSATKDQSLSWQQFSGKVGEIDRVPPKVRVSVDNQMKEKRGFLTCSRSPRCGPDAHSHSLHSASDRDECCESASADAARMPYGICGKRHGSAVDFVVDLATKSSTSQ